MASQSAGSGERGARVTPRAPGRGRQERGEEEVTLSWLESIGRHFVGAGVVHVMPRLMRALRAFMRAWSEDKDDEVEV